MSIDMASVSIEYCHECMYLGRALAIAQQTLKKHAQKLESLEVIPGKDGVFSVKFNDEVIYEIGHEGLLPQADQIEELIKRKLGY